LGEVGDFQSVLWPNEREADTAALPAPAGRVSADKIVACSPETGTTTKSPYNRHFFSPGSSVG
jgi:hypothetical protein